MSNNIKFDYNFYITSYANKYLKWEIIIEEVKRVIAKHKSKFNFNYYNSIRSKSSLIQSYR